METPRVQEIVPEWHRKPKPHLKLALGHLSTMQSLPDNVIVLAERREVTQDPDPQHDYKPAA